MSATQQRLGHSLTDPEHVQPPNPSECGVGGWPAQRRWGGQRWKWMVRRPWRSTTSPPGAGEVGETASSAWPGEVGLRDRGCRRPLGGACPEAVCVQDGGVFSFVAGAGPTGRGLRRPGRALTPESHRKCADSSAGGPRSQTEHRAVDSLQRLSKGIQGSTCHFFQ